MYDLVHLAQFCAIVFVGFESCSNRCSVEGLDSVSPNDRL